jgi:hypothetical protein
MHISHPQLIWANKPGCSRVVAEFWIGENDLWFTIFVDDEDKALKIEVLPSRTERTGHVIDFTEVERLVEAAKRELLVLAARSTLTD